MTKAAQPHWKARRDDGAKGAPDTGRFVIRYRRPEARWSLIQMTVPDGAEAAQAQKMRLEALGYSVTDISPPIPDAVQQLQSA